MDIKKAVQQQFGKSANSYVNSKIHKEGNDLQKLLTIADVSIEMNMLDIATGGGHTANTFAPFIKRVTAVDLTQEMLGEAEKFITSNGHQNVVFQRADAENLPFSDESFDIVTCRIAPHHFPNVNKFIEEVYRVLKKNGQFLLDDNVVPEDDEADQFYNCIEKIRDYSHYRAWKKSEWLQMLEQRGFEIIEWHRFEKTFHFEPWCGRMNLSAEDKENLIKLILLASDKLKTQFRIIIEDGKVNSFAGEAMVIKAVKR